MRRGPVVQIDFANHDRVTPERVAEIVEALRTGEVPTPSRVARPKDFRDASRILAGAEEHVTDTKIVTANWDDASVVGIDGYLAGRVRGSPLRPRDDPGRG